MGRRHKAEPRGGAVGNHRHMGVQLIGEPRRRSQPVSFRQNILIGPQLVGVIGNGAGQFPQNPTDFLLFLAFQHFEIIVKINELLGFDKHGLARLAGAMDNAGNVAFFPGLLPAARSALPG